MTPSSTESAWGPRDWSSHGGGGSWPETPADLAPAPGSRPSPGAEPQPGEARFGDAPFGEARSDKPAPGRGARGRRSDRRGGRRSADAAGGASDEASGEDAPVGAAADPASRARDICLRLLTGQARTRRQLADALRRKEIPDEVAEQVLDRLTEVGLIDDAAYARSWVEQRQRSRGLARRALAGELRAKGVDSALVAEAVAEVDPDDEEAAARRLVERKLSSTRGLDRQVRLRRLAGMLARRGYPEGLALRVVRALLDEEAAEDDESAVGLENDHLDSGEE
ncbi:regulatory protein RecX [Streptacidiphilus jiangxiensis]|uniref:Regulatory protein RecX n=1 Tax=Streptacidiphilus jiangxiensis TaxID=235985 RepID=A0A1H7KG72_STRJI|nr:regulatory protein RecX [Streptacidiphilus jiangxiensis]SEK85789.1 regulatory protein [Streptacidiphilus jiangxiensis]